MKKILTGWLYHTSGAERDHRAMAFCARHGGCCLLPAEVVELNRWRSLSWIFELAYPGLKKSDVLFEQARSGDFGTRRVLAIVGSVVGYAATAGGFVAVAFL